jgi:hypothetical protein
MAQKRTTLRSRTGTKLYAKRSTTTSSSTSRRPFSRSSRRQIFLQNRPELGDVSRGEVVSINNFHRLFKDILTPVQLEATRGRAVDALPANAGHGLGHGFLDQEFNAIRTSSTRM